MDEIIDRIKKTKVNRKYLFLTLIFTEILGILILIWVLRTPLYQKFFISQPKAFALSQMNSQTRYLLTQGDYLLGEINKDNKIVVLIRAGDQIQEKAKIQPSSGGDWYYQLPLDISPGIKIITVGELDHQNKVKSTQNYKVRVQSNDRLVRNKFYQKFVSLFEKPSKQIFQTKTTVSPTPFPKTFSAHFEYDDKNKTLGEIQSGSKSGQLTSLTNQPASGSGIINYRLEIKDGDNNIVKSGWGQMKLESENLYTFSIETDYIKSGLINIYLPNNTLLWRRVLK